MIIGDMIIECVIAYFNEYGKLVLRRCGQCELYGKEIVEYFGLCELRDWHFYEWMYGFNRAQS